MHFKASLLEIKLGYRKIKSIAHACLVTKDYDRFNKYFNYCVTIVSQFNWIYRDDEMEDLQHEYADAIINKSDRSYNPNQNNWVFYDDYSTSYVLALQWMSALSNTGKNILYITSQYSFEKRIDLCIIDTIKNMPNVSVCVIPAGTLEERANLLYRTIIDFGSSKLILHKGMNSLVNIPLSVLPSNIEKYNINLGDQFFWMGAKWLDYNIEFRPFGASVSSQLRGLKREQLLMVPFYPANENRPFQGFPPICNNKTVIFSGGDFYKTIDQHHSYWDLVKAILDKHKDVIFLFATKRSYNCQLFIEDFIKKNHFEDRFCYIQYRQDIFQVFAHCDIYMGTSPISGSLMSQLAAINGKPILQYYPPGTQDDETEQAICINEHFPISFSNKKDFLDEAERLLNDRNFRRNQGMRLKKAMMNESQFNQLVNTTLVSDKSQMPLGIYQINHSYLTKRWLKSRDERVSDIGEYIYSIIGAKDCIRSIPSLFIKKNLNRIFRNIAKP